MQSASAPLGPQNDELHCDVGGELQAWRAFCGQLDRQNRAGRLDRRRAHRLLRAQIFRQTCSKLLIIGSANILR